MVDEPIDCEMFFLVPIDQFFTRPLFPRGRSEWVGGGWVGGQEGCVVTIYGYLDLRQARRVCGHIAVQRCLDEKLCSVHGSAVVRSD